MILKKWYIIGIILFMLITSALVFINDISLYFAKNKPTNIFFEHPMFLYYEKVTNTSEEIRKRPLEPYHRSKRMIFFSLSKEGDVQANTIIKHNKFSYEYSSAFTVKDMNELQSKSFNGPINNKLYSINVSKADIKVQYERDIDKDGFTEIVDGYQSILVCTLADSRIGKGESLHFIKDDTYNAVEIKYIDNYRIYIFRLPYTNLKYVNINNFSISGTRTGSLSGAQGQ